MPEIGDIAPDFTLQETFDTSVTLSDYRGKKNVLLFFLLHGDLRGRDLRDPRRVEA